MNLLVSTRRFSLGECYATIFCINSTNSCSFSVLVDFLHHPTFPRGENCGDFFDAQQLPLVQNLINKYGKKEIVIIGEFYGNQKTDQDGNIYEPIINKKELEKEWVSVRQFMTNFREFKFVEQ